MRFYNLPVRSSWPAGFSLGPLSQSSGGDTHTTINRIVRGFLTRPQLSGKVGNAAQHIAACTCTKTSKTKFKRTLCAFCFFKCHGKADLQANKTTTILKQVMPFSPTSSSTPSGCCGAQLSTAESRAPARWLRQTCFLVSSCQSKNQENRKCTK